MFYPGEYVLGSALFLLTLFVLKRDLNKARAKSDPDSPVSQLVDNDVTTEQYDEIRQEPTVYENSAYSNNRKERKDQKIN